MVEEFNLTKIICYSISSLSINLNQTQIKKKKKKSYFKENITPYWKIVFLPFFCIFSFRSQKYGFFKSKNNTVSYTQKQKDISLQVSKNKGRMYMYIEVQKINIKIALHEKNITKKKKENLSSFQQCPEL